MSFFTRKAKIRNFKFKTKFLKCKNYPKSRSLKRLELFQIDAVDEPVAFDFDENL